MRPLAVALVLAQTLPLAFRRLAPVPVPVLLGVVTGVHGASTVSDPTVFFGALVALYTAVSLSDGRTSIVLGAVTAVAVGSELELHDPRIAFDKCDDHDPTLAATDHYGLPVTVAAR